MAQKIYENALELTDLVKDFDGKRAVDHITMNLKRGEILGMLGPNGAGKTTTIRMILNIIAPDEGKLRVLGEPFSEALKNRIGFLPEERGLYRKMKVMEVLQFMGELKGMKPAEIRRKGREMLAQFDLADYEHRKIEELSKGMAQKVQFISTILHDPEVLILDEPFSGLDPVNIEIVSNLILTMKKRGVSIIFSTHLMEYAEKIIDSVVMIDQGKKVLDGPLTALKAEYGRKFVRAEYEGDASFVASLPYVSQVRDQGREMEIEIADLSRKNELIRDLNDRLVLHSFQMAEPSLQTIFIRKVKEGGAQ